jgi:RNA 3'-terminal phosphate cyclase (ATP)
MIVIDGSQGEGGGQMLRSALALSLVTGKPFRMHDIRGRRPRPGVMRQHVTAVEAACAIGGAECAELKVGASDLTFVPGRVKPGEYRFAVGTAGSTSLVFQTVLPPLMLAERPSRLVLEGGTHNIYAPPFDFIDRVFLPVINRMGPQVTARLVRPGFYPAGGGRVEIDIVPSATLARMDLVERGQCRRVEARAVIAALPDDIARRELAAVEKILGWPGEYCRIHKLPDEVGPGNILILAAAFEHCTEVVSGFGKLGVSAQSVGDKAAKRMAGYLASDAFAGPYLADQLLLPLALAGGGRFSTVKPSQHARTGAEIIASFLDVSVAFHEQENGCHIVEVSRS